MEQFWSLLKVHLKLRFGFTELRHNLKANPKKARRTIGFGVLILFVICYVLAFYGFIAYSLISAAKSINMAEMVLGTVILSAQVVVLIFGIFYMMSLYHSKDMELLASLPIPPIKAFSVKFIMALLSEIGTFAIITIPIFVIYGVLMGAAYGFYLKAVVVVLFGALPPMVISGLIAALLVRVSVFTRRRDLIATVGGFVLMAGLMIGNMTLSMSLQKGLLSGGLSSMLSDQSALLNTITGSFPPASWAAQGLTQEGLASFMALGLLVLVSLAGAAFIAVVAGKMYFTGALAQLETAKRAKSKDVSTSFSNAKSPVSAVFFKEWRVVLRSPNYALNSLVGIIIGPLMLIMISLSVGGSSNGAGQLTLLLQGSGILYASLGLCALMIFVVGMNTAAATAVSREGRSFWIAKTVPVSAKLQIKGKFYFGCSIALLGVFTTALTGDIILGLPLLSVIAGAVVALLIGATISAIGINMDMSKPKLFWESEQQAIKQNMNAFLAVMLGFAMIIIFGIAGALLVVSQLPEVLVWLILIALAFLIFIAFERLMSAKADKAYDNIDF